jgi:phage-related protein (TIGR01555 family)
MQIRDIFLKKKKESQPNNTGNIQIRDGFEMMYGKAANQLQNGKDVLKNSTFSRVIRLSEQVCENVFLESWVGKKIVQLPVERAMMSGIMLEMDNEADEKKIWQAYEDLDVENLITKAQISADIYGSSLILLKDDTQDSMNVARDFKNLEMKLIEYPFYSIQPSFEDTYEAGIVTFTNLGISVDQSFVVPFIGSSVVKRLSPEYKYYGMSVYQNLWNTIINDSVITTAVANITARSSIRHYKLDGLKEMVASGREDLALKRIGVIEQSIGLFASAIMDSKDELQIVGQTLNGLADIDKRSAERLSSASGIPATELLGKSPDGQNSTGKGDQKTMINFIKTYQKKMLPSVVKIFDALASHVGLADKKRKVYFKNPHEIDSEERPIYDKVVIENANTMLNSLGLPEDVIRGYLLSHQIITQEQHDKINLETEKFDEVDETDTAKDE